MAKKIDTIFTVEIMAVNKEKTKESLEEYIEKIEFQKYIKINNKIFSDLNKIDNPRENIKEAYWQSVEVEAEFDSLKNLLYFVMTFGPSSVEIVGPKSMEIKMHEVQEIVGGIAEILHRFAAQGAGGIVVAKK